MWGLDCMLASAQQWILGLSRVSRSTDQWTSHCIQAQSHFCEFWPALSGIYELKSKSNTIYSYNIEDTFKTAQNSTIKRRKNPDVNTMFCGAVILIPEWCMLVFDPIVNCIVSVFKNLGQEPYNQLQSCTTEKEMNSIFLAWEKSYFKSAFLKNK